MVLRRVVAAVFCVLGAGDADTERRSWFLLYTALALELLIVGSAVTTALATGDIRNVRLSGALGLPALVAVFLLARRARADAAGLVLSGFVLVLLVGVAWTQGVNSTRISAAVLGVVAMGSVLSTRRTALVGLAMIAIVVGFGAAESAGVHRIDPSPAIEAEYVPFIRQSTTLGLLMLLLRRGYDRLQRQVRDRESARAEAVSAARSINDSLEAVVAERTTALAATRDRLSALAAQFATDLSTTLGATRHQLAALGSDPALGGDAQYCIARAGKSVTHLLELTARLHEHARIGTAALRSERLEMTQLAHEVADDHARTSAAIAWTIDPLPAARADPALTRAILDNLISNAVKFSRHRQPPRIHIGHDSIRGYFVRDNGAGFAQHDAGKLFVAFQRLHSDDRFEGHGLGLANVQRILLRLGGDIAAEAEPDRGATFFFRLPGAEDSR
ncbi:MAG TPA: ATP-binding protein [Kofleriaceae bacterium]|nr:ATP-binding protein [Kofleriaceae bacterium]